MAAVRKDRKSMKSGGGGDATDKNVGGSIVIAGSDHIPGASGGALVVQCGSGVSRRLLTAWLARYTSPASRKSLLEALRRATKPLGADPADVVWWDLSPAELSAMRLYLAANYKPATARQALTAMRGVVRAAWREGLVDRDRLERLLDQPAIPGFTEPPGRSLSALEVERMVRACRPAKEASRAETVLSTRAGAVLALGYGAGLRRAEVCSLTLDSISDANRIRVLGKGSKERIVPIPRGARGLLDVWLTVRGTTAGPLICRVTRGGRVLPNKALTPGAVWAVVAKLCDVAGVARITPHDLRRTYASQLLETGADLAEVQHLLGHSDSRTTARYDRRPEASRARAVARLPVLGSFDE